MKQIILVSVTLLSVAGIASAAVPPDAIPASTYQCFLHNSPLAQPINQSLRLAQATSDCQATYPCPGNDINIPSCSKLKACMGSCG